MVDVFGDGIAYGTNLQVAKKVVTTVGQYKDYTAEIQQSYELGFTPNRPHRNVDDTFVTPIRTYEGRVYILDDVAKMAVTDWYIASDTISSKLIYFAKGDDGGSGDMFALHGDRGPSGAKGLKADSGDRVPPGSRGPAGKRGAAGPGGPPGKIGKTGPAGAHGGVGARGEKDDKWDYGGVC